MDELHTFIGGAKVNRAKFSVISLYRAAPHLALARRPPDLIPKAPAAYVLLSPGERIEVRAFCTRRHARPRNDALQNRMDPEHDIRQQRGWRKPAIC